MPIPTRRFMITRTTKIRTAPAIRSAVPNRLIPMIQVENRVLSLSRYLPAMATATAIATSNHPIRSESRRGPEVRVAMISIGIMKARPISIGVSTPQSASQIWNAASGRARASPTARVTGVKGTTPPEERMPMRNLRNVFSLVRKGRTRSTITSCGAPASMRHSVVRKRRSEAARREIGFRSRVQRHSARCFPG